MLAFSAEPATPEGGRNLTVLYKLVQLLLATDPSIGLIRCQISNLQEYLVRQIEATALRRSAQVSSLSPVATDLVGWSKNATAINLVAQLRLCLVEGGMLVPGRKRMNGKQSAPRFQPLVFGRGRGLHGVPKPKGGRPADNAQVRLVSMLAIDWLLTTHLPPTSGRDGSSPFSRLVHDVFDWLGMVDKAPHSLRQYWSLVPTTDGNRRSVVGLWPSHR